VNVLVVDIGGSGVKMAASRTKARHRFRSGRQLTPDLLMRQVLDLTHDWPFDAVAIGYPGVVAANTPVREPGNLACGWVSFDFERAFGKPVRVVNDAVMQALGAYDGGRMLFLGLGTGVGSALVSEHVVMPLELGSLPHVSHGNIADRLGRAARQRDGQPAWQHAVIEIVPVLQEAFLADYVVLGGGNARRVDPLPPHTRRGGNRDAFVGGCRLWEETVEPHDRASAQVWRIVRWSLGRSRQSTTPR
jgi:polyphosphate glucokinase